MGDRAAIGHWARAEIRSDDKSLKAKSELLSLVKHPEVTILHSKK